MKNLNLIIDAPIIISGYLAPYFTEEDIANAKKGILATIKTIDDEQDTQISYYFGQELTNTRVSTEEYIKKIEKIQKEDVINIARKVSINTIYFLKD